MKILTLLKVLWTFKNPANRKKFKFAIRDYMEDVSWLPSGSALIEEPYKRESPQNKRHDTILLVTHEFSRTGAPYAVLYLARALHALYGKLPVVISPSDGPMREEFERERFVTIVDPMLFSYRSYASASCDFVSKFDRVIVTSLCAFSFIRYYRGIAKRMTWWIHETDKVFSDIEELNVDLPLLCAACESIWLGSPLCFPPAQRYVAPDKLHLLLYGCEDTAVPHRPHQSGKIVISIVGSIEQRKGQDVFLDAIELLPADLRSKAVFRIIGSPLPTADSHAYYEKICGRAARIAEVECYENMPMDRLRAFYAETDVLVSASRDDPMPVTITQGLMNSRVCLCSSAIGHAQLLQDGQNGLIFNNESATGLAEKMTWVLRNTGKLADMGAAGRAVFEAHFLMSGFIQNVGNLLNDESGIV